MREIYNQIIDLYHSLCNQFQKVVLKTTEQAAYFSLAKAIADGNAQEFFNKPDIMTMARNVVAAGKIIADFPQDKVADLPKENSELPMLELVKNNEVLPDNVQLADYLAKQLAGHTVILYNTHLHYFFYPVKMDSYRKTLIKNAEINGFPDWYECWLGTSNQDLYDKQKGLLAKAGDILLVRSMWDMNYHGNVKPEVWCLRSQAQIILSQWDGLCIFGANNVN